MEPKLADGAEDLQLDRLDMKILTALIRDGRITKASLSDAVGLSPTACCARIDRLERKRFIRGYHADVDVEQLANLTRFVMTVSLRDYTPKKARRFEAIIADIPFVVQCDAVSGSAHFVLQILAESTSHFHETVKPMLAMEIDYTTFTVSRTIQRQDRADLAALIPDRMMRGKQPSRTVRSQIRPIGAIL